MISQNTKLVNRIASCLRLDRQDPTHLRIDIQAILHYLNEFGLPVPPGEYEHQIKKLMLEHVKNKALLGSGGLIFMLSTALVALAEEILVAAEESFQENLESVTPELKGLLTEEEL